MAWSVKLASPNKAEYKTKMELRFKEIKKGQLFVREKKGDRWCSVDLLDPQQCSDELFRKTVVNKIMELYCAFLDPDNNGIRPWVYVVKPDEAEGPIEFVEPDDEPPAA